MNTPLELAAGLQHSNIKEVSEICKAFLALNTSYEELQHAYVKLCAERVMERHYDTFKKLAESGD
jgi:hypothetical protein